MNTSHEMQKFAHFFVFCIVALAIFTVSLQASAHDHHAHFHHHKIEINHDTARQIKHRRAASKNLTHTQRINCDHYSHDGPCASHTTNNCDEHKYICCEKPNSLTPAVHYTGRRHSLAEKIDWPCKTTTDMSRPNYSLGFHNNAFLWWPHLSSRNTGWRTKLYSESPRLRI